MSTDPHLGDRVFVYGTLRSGFINNAATLAFRQGATLIGPAHLSGTLYSLGWYPGLVEGAGACVAGEVWRIDTPGLMALLDDYEGLTEPGPPEYERVRRRSTTPDGPVDVWVYLYLGDTHHLHPIPSGDWADAFRPA